MERLFLGIMVTSTYTLVTILSNKGAAVGGLFHCRPLPSSFSGSLIRPVPELQYWPLSIPPKPQWSLCI
jgi:hypothetical protein